MSTLDEIRAKLAAQQNRQEQNANKSSGSSLSYPFWNIAENSHSLIRFLPDGDKSNTFFWAEQTMIKLPFQGVKGEHDREVTVQVPCMEMYGESCPITAEIRPWWKDDQLAPIARKYWRKKSYIFHGFVVASGFPEKEIPENPIRKFSINTSIFDIIKSSLMDPDMEYMPIDYTTGRDFKLTKTMKGGFANYGTSSWSMKTRGLSDVELGAIEKFGLPVLSEYLPAKPTPSHQAAIKEMFHASVNDEAYDPDRWSQFYRPWGSKESTKPVTPSVQTPSVQSAISQAPVTQQVETPAYVPAATAPVTESATMSPTDILAKIRASRMGG